MIGRTNVGGGGRNFTATLQITTGPNAVITAVNLAGDTFSGTADSSGSLTLNISQPGTYTVSETDGGTATVVVADDGETYQIAVFAFDGVLIDGAEQFAEFEALAYSYESRQGVAPTVYYDTTGIPNNIHISLSASQSGVYRSGIYIDLTGYDLLKFSAVYGNNIRIRLIDISGETITTIWSSSYPGDSEFHNNTVSVSALTGMYKIEFLLYDGAHFYVANMHFE